MRVPFSSIFKKNSDGSFEPNGITRIGGVEFGSGVKFTKGVIIAGIDFTNYEGKDFEVEMDNNSTIIRGIYE